MTLKEQNAYLRMENDILKSLRALQKKYHYCRQGELNEKARHAHYNDNVLAQNFKASRPLEKCVTDVSFVYHKHGRMYLSVIKDLYDNPILAYTISDFNDNQLVFRNIDLVFNED